MNKNARNGADVWKDLQQLLLCEWYSFFSDTI